MHFQLREIILWSRDPRRPPRRLPFQTGQVNVITGGSKTGKSAIIPIVDYCLGSDKCAIPVERIRKASSWFGVLIETKEGQQLLARREPGQQRASGEMFVRRGRTVEVPNSIDAGNTTADQVKRDLDQLAGLTNLGFDPDGTGGGFSRRPGFRDMMAFVFQPQHIVANPHALFFRADTYEHRERLKTIFPYVLGAVTPELLAKRYRLDQLRRDLRRKEKELRAVQRVSERWLADLRSWAVQARELGLIAVPIGGNASREELLDLLRGIVAAAAPSDVAPSPKAIEETATEAVALQHRETEASRNLSSLSRRLAEIKKLRESLNEYRHSLVIQRERLGLSDWLKQRSNSEQACVLCGGTYEVSKKRLDDLCSLLHGIEAEAGELKEVPAAIDREYARVMQEVSQETERLSAIRQRKKALTESGAAKTRRFEAASVARFVGNVEQALKTHEELSSDSLLTREVEELKKSVDQLEREVRESGVEGRRRRALARIEKDAGALLPGLDAERPADPITLSIDDLTIKVEGRDREDFLWEIGSGANWLSYHVAVTLALQQFFVSERHSPVPSLLVYDQPSQVYFPRSRRRSEKDGEPILNDEDIEAVRSVFATMAKVVNNTKAKLQVVVLDHAAEDVWGDIVGIHKVEEWRDGQKLVPEDWPLVGSS